MSHIICDVRLVPCDPSRGAWPRDLYVLLLHPPATPQTTVSSLFIPPDQVFPEFVPWTMIVSACMLHRGDLELSFLPSADGFTWFCFIRKLGRVSLATSAYWLLFDP